MEQAAVIVGVVAFVGLIAWFALRWFHRAGREIQVGRARELFSLQRERLEAEFFAAAAATGMPKGLTWKSCEFGAELELARNKSTREMLGLVPVTIAFEAIPGGDMEGVAAVGNLRSATAVFTFQRGNWTTVGRAVFNLSPQQAIRHFHNVYDRIEEKVTPRNTANNENT